MRKMAALIKFSCFPIRFHFISSAPLVTLIYYTILIQITLKIKSLPPASTRHFRINILSECCSWIKTMGGEKNKTKKKKKNNLHNFKIGSPFYLMFYIFLLIGQAQNISSQHLTACQHSNTS